MNSNNPTSILASFSTMKSLVDAQQYQSPYQILAEFIQYIIIKGNLHSFTAIEMKNRLFEVFGFDIPEAVVRTTARGLQFIITLRKKPIIPEELTTETLNAPSAKQRVHCINH